VHGRPVLERAQELRLRLTVAGADIRLDAVVDERFRERLGTDEEEPVIVRGRLSRVTWL